ncbi:MAG TPA: hypothetical protein VGV10_06730 [Thermoleophilaceae bacterium]|nr:hypothetical protein [Thermoleophilaceae bacterium]
MRPADGAARAGGAPLREGLRHVYWLGGGSGAGKSTSARRTAAQHGLHVYDTDVVMRDHASRSTPEEVPYLTRFSAMDMDERWVNQSPERMLETFHWFRGEGFGLIVEDLLRLPSNTGVIAEGFRLLPHLVKPLLSSRDRAVWLLPTPEFRRAAFASRGTAGDISRKTNDPERALRNLLERDRMFTDRLVEETKRLELHAIEVNSLMLEQELAGRVSEAFGLG